MHYHLFICHADEDKSFARRLTLALKKAGVAVWFDEDEIRLGSSIRQAIDRDDFNAFRARTLARYEDAVGE